MLAKAAYLIITVLVLFTISCSNEVSAPSPTPSSMISMTSPTLSVDMVPPVKGFYKGQEILFIHTEASNQGVATMLTAMMGPQVILVPQLGEIPESLLAKVYVFVNGVQGEGPFGFQADVFDSVPGDLSYSPLRVISFVRWNEGSTARELRSEEEINAAESRGETVVNPSMNVVNMPILTWPGGHR